MFKKPLSVCLVLLVLLSLFTSAITVTAEEKNNTGPTTIMTGVITEPGENKIGVKLRADAGTGTVAVLTTLTDGTALTVLGTKNDINNNPNLETQNVYVWYHVQYFGDKTYTGYVREDMITVTTHTITPPDQNFEEQLKNFPESYHSYLRELHQLYPNWIFTADNINLTYQEAIALENVFPRKLVEYSKISWRSMGFGAYNWETGTYIHTDGNTPRWHGASREVIAYYMDPRNFLNPNDAYIFMKQSYDPDSQNIEGVRELLKGSFMEYNYEDPNDQDYGGDYAAVIMAAAQQSGVNPYILASTIIQEQSTNGSIYSNGNLKHNKVTVYNFFNFGVSGDTDDDKRINGAEHAHNEGWTTRSASIIGGAKKYSNNYLNSSPNIPYYNQDTYFYKNYNILNPEKIYHQYAQNVADQVSSASIMRKLYVSNVTTKLTFRIPVYKNNSLPQTVFALPEKNDNQNNYYFNTIEVEGLTPSFSRYTYSYGLQVDKDTSVYVAVPETATIVSPMSFNLTAGDNRVVLTVKSATGYTNDYVISVNASVDCVLTITTESPPAPVIIKGDINNDGKISVSDQAAIRLHVLQTITLTDNAFLAADINNDGKISVSDQAAIRLAILGLIKLN